MTETSQQRSEVAATWSWTFQILGVLLGTATCISIVKNIGAIELYGMPARVFAQYAWLRDMLFEPIAWPLRYLGLTLPWLLKDLILGYLLTGAAFYRGALAYQRRVGVPLSWIHPTVVLTWPGRISRWRSVISEERRWTEKARHANDLEIVGYGEENIRTARKLYWYFALNALVMAIATIGFFVWNSMASGAGPS